jgi:TM2 domain-containing membrane protein YozV
MAKPEVIQENPDKNYFIALALSVLFGPLGLDRFYLGKIGTGILKLITVGGFGIWWLIDFILIGIGKLRAKNDNRPLEQYTRYGSQLKPVVIIFAVLQVLTVLFIFIAVLIAAIAGIWATDKVNDVFEDPASQIDQIQLPTDDLRQQYDDTLQQFQDSTRTN